jgi:hypothetical protein
MLRTLMLLAAATAVQVQSGPGWDDPTDLGRVGPWDLRCVRDGSFTSWNHVEGCSARTTVDGVQLVIVRTANEAYTGLGDVPGCSPPTGSSDISLKALNKPGPTRVRLVRNALRRTIGAAVDRCGAGRDLKTFVARDGDIEAILEASEGLQDLNEPRP